MATFKIIIVYMYILELISQNKITNIGIVSITSNYYSEISLRVVSRKHTLVLVFNKITLVTENNNLIP